MTRVWISCVRYDANLLWVSSAKMLWNNLRGAADESLSGNKARNSWGSRLIVSSATAVFIKSIWQECWLLQMEVACNSITITKAASPLHSSLYLLQLLYKNNLSLVESFILVFQRGMLCNGLWFRDKHPKYTNYYAITENNLIGEGCISVYILYMWSWKFIHFLFTQYPEYISK